MGGLVRYQNYKDIGLVIGAPVPVWLGGFVLIPEARQNVKLCRERERGNINCLMITTDYTTTPGCYNANTK